MLEKIFGTLKTFGQFFTNRIFNYPRPGKADQGAGFGKMNIPHHGIGSRHPPGGGIGQNNDIGQAFLLQHVESHRGSGHLHQGEDSLLHPGPSGRGKNNQRGMFLDSGFHGGQKSIPDPDPHRTGHKEEILHRNDGFSAAQFPQRNLKSIVLAGFFAGLLEAFGIFFLVPEFEGVVLGLRNFD